MPVFSLRREKKEEPKQQVPDELPSLTEPDIPTPTAPKVVAPQGPRQMPLAAKQQPPYALPEIQPEEIAVPVPPQPVAPSTTQAEKPRKLIDHITQIDGLRDQLSNTEREIDLLAESLASKKSILQQLREQLESEINIVKAELGLEQPTYTSRSRIRTNVVLPADKHFYFADGAIAHNVQQLVHHLKRISDDVFIHHCNVHKNDFYFWIRDAVGDHELAERVKHMTSRLEMVRLLSNFA